MKHKKTFSILTVMGIVLLMSLVVQANWSGEIDAPRSVTCAAEDEGLCMIQVGKELGAEFGCPKKYIFWDATTPADANVLKLAMTAMLSGKSINVDVQECINVPGAGQRPRLKNLVIIN